jgi:outer membrane lipopolysaccharide assembly protein LptE/RlpB
MRVGVAVDPALPVLRVDATVTDPHGFVPTDGTTVYASFRAADTNALA